MKPQTKRIVGIIVAMTLMVSVGGAEKSTEVSVKTMPASVLKTVPPAGATDVDPTLREIRVTFSKDMITNRMWSICQISKYTFPETAGKIHYVDKRTCVMPVKLEPGRTYVLWFNRAQFNSFRDTRNTPSIPYPLVFETRK